MEKFKVDFSQGYASRERKTLSGNTKISRYTIFTDTIGLNVFTETGVIFLTENNSEVV